MSQRLPYLPNLDHLKKQAKAVLRVCRVRNARSRLADAQNAVARGFGFQSWPVLKAHVDSVRRSRGAIPDSPGRPKTNGRHHPGTSHPMAGMWANGDIVVTLDVCGDLVTFTQVMTDAAGQQSAARFAFVADGREHEVEGHDFLMQATWIDTRTLDTTVTRDKALVASAKYTLSMDGAVLALSNGAQVVPFSRGSS
jgi:hypothetical protein